MWKRPSPPQQSALEGPPPPTSEPLRGPTSPTTGASDAPGFRPSPTKTPEVFPGSKDIGTAGPQSNPEITGPEQATREAQARKNMMAAGPGAKPAISRVNPAEPETPSRSLGSPHDEPPSSQETQQPASGNVNTEENIPAQVAQSLNTAQAEA